MDITVVIPTHPGRNPSLLNRALLSVSCQTYPAAAMHMQMDMDRWGAPLTRHKGLQAVQTDWVAFLDSDDEFLPHHLEVLVSEQNITQADYVYSWFNVIGGTDPFPTHFGRPWDSASPRATTMTILVRAELAKTVGFLRYNHDALRGGPGNTDEDWMFTLGCVDANAHIVHVPARTWNWHHHGSNTSGRPDRGDAR